MGTQTETRRAKINWLQYRYIAERPFHTSDAAAARVVEVSDSTISNWNADPEFRAQVQAFLDGQLMESRAQLAKLRDKAIVRLNVLLDARDVRTRLRAVVEVLDRVGLMRGESLEVGVSPALAALLADAGEKEESGDG